MPSGSVIEIGQFMERTMKKYKSRAFAASQEKMETLHEVGAIDKLTMLILSVDN